MPLSAHVREFLRGLVHEHGRGDPARAALIELNGDGEEAQAQAPAAPAEPVKEEEGQ